MCVAPRILFETILDQLVGIGVQPGSQSDATGPPFARYAKCDNLAEFVVLLGEIYALEAGKEKESRYLVSLNSDLA